MRKLLSLLLAILLMLSLVACQQEKPAAGGADDTSAEYESDEVTDAPDDGSTTSTTEDTSGGSTTRPNVDGTQQPAALLQTVNSKATALRQSVLNATDSHLQPSGNGRIYYISHKGSDTGNGSQSSPWRNTAKINSILKQGDVILFERGGIYRSVALNLPKGVSVGAYGSGAKPLLYGGDKDYADASLWKNEGGNIWSVDVTGAVALCPGTNLMPEDIGCIIFDHGSVVNGDGKKRDYGSMSKDYDFYYKPETNTLYLYLASGNPASSHSSIEMSPNTETIYIRTHDHIIENLSIKYSASGIGAAGSNNITIRGCEIGYIGGGLQSNTRAGNAITFFNTTDNCLVENNWIYQCFDAGYSHQSQEGIQQNITIRNNLIELCLYNIEMWSDSGNAGDKVPAPMKNILIENNIMRNAGFGFGTLNRSAYNSSSVWASHISMNSNNSQCVNTVIRNNIFDTSYRYMVCICYPNDANGRGPTITGNTWLQESCYRPKSAEDSIGTTATIWPITPNGSVGHGCADQAAMETSVTALDQNPAGILLKQ